MLLSIGGGTFYVKLWEKEHKASWTTIPSIQQKNHKFGLDINPMPSKWLGYEGRASLRDDFQERISKGLDYKAPHAYL